MEGNSHCLKKYHKEELFSIVTQESWLEVDIWWFCLTNSRGGFNICYVWQIILFFHKRNNRFKSKQKLSIFFIFSSMNLTIPWSSSRIRRRSYSYLSNNNNVELKTIFFIFSFLLSNVKKLIKFMYNSCILFLKQTFVFVCRKEKLYETNIFLVYCYKKNHEKPKTFSYRIRFPGFG